MPEVVLPTEGNTRNWGATHSLRTYDSVSGVRRTFRCSAIFGRVRFRLGSLCGGMIRHFGLHDDTAREVRSPAHTQPIADNSSPGSARDSRGRR
jgi:hypothetical protein